MILIIGPGAVGGVLAARLSQGGERILLLGRSGADEARLIDRGLTYAGGDGRRKVLHWRLYSARRSQHSPCAAAFFCVESADLSKATRSARAWIGPDTAVVGLQNGLGHQTFLRNAFGARRTVLGSCYFAADRPKPFTFINSWGNDIQLSKTSTNGQALSLSQRLLRKGSWRVHLIKDERRMLWTKLCFSAAVNLLGALCCATNGELARDPALREIMLQALREAMMVARKTGVAPLYPNMEKLTVRALSAAPLQRNSMLQDLQAGRKTELKAIAGPILSAGRRFGLETPILNKLARLVGKLEKARWAR